MLFKTTKKIEYSETAKNIYSIIIWGIMIYTLCYALVNP